MKAREPRETAVLGFIWAVFLFAKILAFSFAVMMLLEALSELWQ